MKFFKRKHYVVICKFAVEDVILNGLEIAGVTHSLHKAKEILAKAAADERQYAKEQRWEIRKDTDMEFDAGETGNYDFEHSHYYIQEV